MNPQRRPPGHPDWCAADHQCGIGEHRADPILVDLPGHGRAALVRIQNPDRRQYAEIRLTVALADVEPVARWQLVRLLADLRALVTRATLATHHHPARRATS